MSSAPVPKPYTPRELARLRKIAASGKSSREASKLMRRPHAGLRFKAMVEKIHFFSVKQPAGVQKRIAARKRRGR